MIIKVSKVGFMILIPNLQFCDMHDAGQESCTKRSLEKTLLHNM